MARPAPKKMFDVSPEHTYSPIVKNQIDECIAFLNSTLGVDCSANMANTGTSISLDKLQALLTKDFKRVMNKFNMSLGIVVCLVDKDNPLMYEGNYLISNLEKIKQKVYAIMKLQFEEFYNESE